MMRRKKRRLQLEALEQRHLLSADISLIRHFDLWGGGVVRSTDPAGVTYHPPTGHLYISDSEINEIPEFVGHNVFEISTRGDQVFREIASNNSEPTGIEYNTFDGFFYVTNDDDHTLSRYDNNLNSRLMTIDTRTATPDASDPEGVTSDPATGNLFVVDGKGGGKQVLVYNSNLAFQYRFGIGNETRDGEGIAFDPITKNLFIVSSPDMAVFEYTTAGQYIKSYSLSGFNPVPMSPQGLAFAPSSDPNDDPNNWSLYIADGMVDNFADGRIYEAAIARPPAGVETVEVRVATGSDDAEEKASGSMSVGSSDLELVYDGGNQTVGMRFTNISIPRGAEIVNAYVQFQADETNSVATSLLIQGEAVDDATGFTTSRYNLSTRPRTSAGVNWSPNAWNTRGEAGADQRTPNLAAVIQEIVDRSLWNTGNSLALIVTGTGERVAESYEGSSTGAPLLHIEYRTTGQPPTNTPPQVAAGADQAISFGTVATLDGTASDDGFVQPLVTTWSKVSGPGNVTFGNAAAVDTTASFASAGTYVLRLTGDDGEHQVSDDVTIEVLAGQFQTLEVRVTASSDDAEEKPSGSVSISSTDLELVYDRGDQTVGLRFNGITIPRGAAISNAYVQFQADEKNSGFTSLLIQGENVDSAATFTTASKNISSRPKTSASIAWEPAPWLTVGEAGPDQRTPNIAAVIQQIVDRSGWVNGNSLVILITGSGERVAESYNGSETGAPLLHVEFSVGGSATLLAEGESSPETFALLLPGSPSDQPVVDPEGTETGPIERSRVLDRAVYTRRLPPTVALALRDGRLFRQNRPPVSERMDLLAQDEWFARLANQSGASLPWFLM